MLGNSEAGGYVSRAYLEGLKLIRTMKRKDVEEFYDDFSSICLSNSSRKFRRLDAEFVRVMGEDPNVNATQVLERGLSQELPCTGSAMVHTDAASVDTLPTSNTTEERALVLYGPTKTPFVKYPSPQEFPIVVQSDLIPGLMDYLSSWRIAELEKSEEDGMSKEKNSEGLRDSLAVVPWVAFHSPMVFEGGVSAACKPLEAEGEMMDTDEPYVSSNNGRDTEIGEKVEAVGVMSPCQQQHYTMLSLSQNTFTPMNW